METIHPKLDFPIPNHCVSSAAIMKEPGTTATEYGVERKPSMIPMRRFFREFFTCPPADTSSLFTNLLFRRQIYARSIDSAEFDRRELVHVDDGHSQFAIFNFERFTF
jgi:hypothetical protein